MYVHPEEAGYYATQLGRVEAGHSTDVPGSTLHSLWKKGLITLPRQVGTELTDKGRDVLNTVRAQT